jgi:hypothetical protein
VQPQQQAPRWPASTARLSVEVPAPPRHLGA